MLIFMAFFELRNFLKLGVIKRQAFQSSVLLYIGTLIGFVTTGLIAPHLLTKSEIGTLRLLLSYSAIFMSIGALGFGTVTIRFLPQFYDVTTRKHNGFLGVLLIAGTLGFVLSLIIIEIIKPSIIENNIEKSPQFARYFFLIIPLTIFQIFYTLLDSYNNALYRSAYGVFLRDFAQRILILIGLILVFLHYFDFQAYLYYYVIATCLPTVLILIHIIRHQSFDIKIKRKFYTRTIIGSVLSVGAFGVLNTISNIAALQIDSIMINMYLDDAAVGVYVITFFFGTLVFIPSKALNKIAPTIIAKAYKENDFKTIQDVYYRSCRNLFLIGILLLIGLWVNLDNVFHLIPRSYEEGRWVIVIIGFANLIKMAGGSNDSVIIYSKYFRVTTAFLVIFAILIILFNYLFIPVFGITGAAIATLAALILHNLMKFIFIRIKFGLNPYNPQYLVVLALSVLIYFMVDFIPDPGNYLIDIAVDSMLSAALFYAMISRLPIAHDLNHSINQAYEKAIVFFRTKS
jgi:O-antigen/teichoic acid export membrane protein